MLLNLEKGSMVTVELSEQDCLVQCRSGRVWITVAGDLRDYFLEGTGERLISGPGRMVIEALDGTCLGMHSESEITVQVNEDYCAAALGKSEIASRKSNAAHIKEQIHCFARIFRIPALVRSRQLKDVNSSDW